MKWLNNIVFQLGLELRLKALCFCLKDLWNTSPDCFIPFLLYVFVVRHGPSWRRTQILKFQKFLEGFRTLVDLHWNLPVLFGYTPWHSQQKKTFQNRALEDYLETKITCAKSIARWFKDIQSDLFIRGHLTFFFGGGHKNHHPKKVTIAELPRWLFLHFPLLLQRCFRYFS